VKGYEVFFSGTLYDFDPVFVRSNSCTERETAREKEREREKETETDRQTEKDK
jgi:hypothetical protein